MALNKEEDFPFLVTSHQVPVFPFRQYPRATLNEHEELFISVNQYTPKPSFSPDTGDDNAVTIIAAGGLGFFKELYEPLFGEFLLRAKSHGFSIRAIWIADMFNTGISALHNQENLGCDPAWWDHARDLFCMVHHFRQQMVRPIVGLAHSMGANSLAYLSQWHPRLFDLFAFIEAGLDPDYGRKLIFPWTMLMLRQKDTYSTKEEAELELIKRHTATTWDKRVLSRLAQHGLCQVEGSKEWRMTTPKHQIATLVLRFDPNDTGMGPRGYADVTDEMREIFPDRDPAACPSGKFYNLARQVGWHLIPHIRPRVLYINGSNSPIFGAAETRDERAKLTGTGVGGNGGMAAGAVEQVIIEGGEHTMPFDEGINKVADVLAAWTGKEVSRWRDGEKKRLLEWQAKCVEEKQSVPAGFVEALGKHMRSIKPPSKPKL